MNDRNEWGSNLSFILAVIGSAVGLGNIWRYPYVLYSNGGGAFYIPYLTAILVLAIPFLILEYGVGYNFKSSFTKAVVEIKPQLEYFGWILPVVIFIMTIYYSTVIGWDGIYLSVEFMEYVAILIVLLVILLIASLILTVLPPKSDNWFDDEERI